MTERAWLPGYSQSELDGAQERYGLHFPPDLIALLRERRLPGGYDWHRDDPRIHEMLRWPLEMLMFGVEDGYWWPDWGDRPDDAETRCAVVTEAVALAPRLIPIFGHRFLPETPSLPGNPVFSMYGFDTIIYGANLTDYLANEFQGAAISGIARHIPFWTDLVEGRHIAYAEYEKYSDLNQH